MTYETTSQEKVWVTFDERAWTGDPEECAVMVADSSLDTTLAEVKKYRDEHWPNHPIYEYDVVDGEMMNQRLIG